MGIHVTKQYSVCVGGRGADSVLFSVDISLTVFSVCVFVCVCAVCMYRLEITIPVGWVLNTNN